MVDVTLPRANQGLINLKDGPQGNAGTATREFYNYLRQLSTLTDSAELQAEIDALIARIEAIESADGFTISGQQSVRVFGQPSDALVTLMLQNDQANPLPISFYSTGDDGNKGWNQLFPHWIPNPFAEYLVDENGNYLSDENGAFLTATDPDMVGANYVSVAYLPNATHRDLQKYLDVMNSPGLVAGGFFSDGGGGNLNVAAGTVAIRPVDDDTSTLYMADFPAAVLAIPSDSVARFIGVERNGLTPQVILKTSDTWDMDTEFPLGSVANLGGTLFPFYNPFKVGDPITNIIQRFDAQATIIRAAAGGLVLGNTGTREATLTAGVAWARLNDYAITAKASNTQTLIGVRPNSVPPPPLVFDLGLTQWPNTQYLNGTTLTTMTNNRWANLWFFVNIGTNAWGFAYGTDEYNNASAAAQEVVPAYLTANFLASNLLLGRFIFEKSNDTPIIETAFATTFGTGAVSDHNQLSNLQGGQLNEYYHLTAAQHADLALITQTITNGDTTHAPSGDAVFDALATKLDNSGDTSLTGGAGAATVNFMNTTTGTTLGSDGLVVGIDGAGTAYLFHRENFNLLIGTNNTTRMSVTNDGRIYGTAIHNNAGAVTGTTNQYLASGTYTPTLTNVTNITTSAAAVCQWMRVGNVVTVSGRLDVTATVAAGTASQVDVSLPIASNLALTGQLGGSGTIFYTPALTVGILPETTNDRARFLFAAQTTTSMAVSFSFTYLVV